MPKLFGRSKSKSSLTTPDTTNEVAPPPERKVKKSKSFKRIRGFIKKTRGVVGRSSSRKQAAADEQSLYAVDVDERSVMTRQTNPPGAGSTPTTPTNNSPLQQQQTYILKVVLLLMDPETRRFELLQLEFDSLKALVSDVLAQIPISVTEDALRLQMYTGIVGPEGQEMLPAKLLATFCKGNEVLVAVPDGVPPRECVRLARPILSDVKVITMLAASGIDSSSWKDDSKKNRKKRSTLKSSRSSSSSIPDQVHHQQSKTKASSSSSSRTGFSFVFILMCALILQVFHTYVSAPIKPGSITAPGTWLAKCGLLTLWPSCENAYLHLDRSGVLTYYSAEKEIQWKVEGKSCPPDDKGCVHGMHVLNDGSIHIGGHATKSVVSFGGVDPDLSPWPFVEAPKLRVWKK